MPVERTDELTEYEYEYEFLQDEAFKQMIKDAMNKAAIQVDENNKGFTREFSMDPDEYNHIAELAEQGEFIDFEIPKDAPMGKKASEAVLGIEKEEDQLEPVDLDELFNPKE